MISYQRLDKILKERRMKWIDLQAELNLSPTVMARLHNDRPVNTTTINKVCNYLQIQPGDFLEWIEEDA